MVTSNFITTTHKVTFAHLHAFAPGLPFVVCGTGSQGTDTLVYFPFLCLKLKVIPVLSQVK